MDLNILILESMQKAITNNFFLFTLLALIILIPVFKVIYFIFKGTSKRI